MRRYLKICGLTRAEDVAAAAAAGVTHVDFVLVPGSARAVSLAEAAVLAAAAPPGVKTVCVLRNPSPAEVAEVISAVKPDVVQLHGDESPALARSITGAEVWKAVVLRTLADVERAADFPAAVLVADSGEGGSGVCGDWRLVTALARRRAVLVAGGITPENAVRALRVTGAAGVDTSGGVEEKRRCKSRVKIDDLARRIRSMDTHYGPYGGQYIAETLMPALLELETEYLQARSDPVFQAELHQLLRDYVGRESPLYLARRLTAHCGGAQIYLKREDLNHTGAHKINNTLGQALLARRMGKRRIIAETGAGMHGVASATVAALFGLECEVFMGAVDIARQAPNVERMKTLGAKVRAVTDGSATLKDAMNEAIREWTACSEDTFYMIGTCAGPHPYPMLVKDFQSVIGREARRQCLTQAGKLPREVIACVGGGSNAIGIFAGFQDDAEVVLTGVEAGGYGLATGRHAASINGGKVGILHGAKTYLLQDENGQVQETHSVSAGLDYPGVGPEHCLLADLGRATYQVVNDDEAVAAFETLSRLEGIIPALESSHAVAQAMHAARRYAAEDAIVVNLSGRGDKDMDNIRQYKEGRGQ